MIDAVEKVVPFRAVPQPHDAEGEKEADVGGGVLVLEPLALRRREQETHVDVVAKPKRQRDVPAVPEVADIRREEGLVEILRRVNAEQVADGNGEGTVAREIEE